MRHKNPNDRERERHERFQRNLRNVNAYRYGEGAPGAPFLHPDFMPAPAAQIVKSLKIQLPKLDNADDMVIVSRSEYNEFVAAKVTMGLLIAAVENKALRGYDIESVLRMMSGVGKEQDASSVASDPEAKPEQAAEA